MSTGRSTNTRDKHRAAIKAKRPLCHICKQTIDYSLPYLDPMEFVVDHVIPVAKGGPDTLENKAAAHRSCNRAKGDKYLSQMQMPAAKVLTTSRSW